MADTLPHVIAVAGTWTELTGAGTGVSAGDEFDVSNAKENGTDKHTCYVAIAATKPADSLVFGVQLTIVEKGSHTYRIGAGNNPVWAKPKSDEDVPLSLQPRD